MRLGALTGSSDTAPVTGFAIDHRKVAPSRYSALSRRAIQWRGFHPGAVSSGAVAVVSGDVEVDGAIPRRRERAVNSPASPPSSSSPFQRR
jgi:UDP-N-acetylmuramoyl-L-alanyl-D-glutamate--2,6-diaminopimelate ligase